MRILGQKSAIILRHNLAAHWNDQYLLLELEAMAIAII